jgi:hypothetical protein
MSKPKPINTQLYNMVKQMATEKFDSPTGAYRSMWIVKKYKELGGVYDKPKPSNSKLDKWRNEKWIDLNQPKIMNNTIIGYERCGKKNNKNMLYPLCRPSIKIDDETPLIYQNISKNRIMNVNKQKQILKNMGNIRF